MPLLVYSVCPPSDDSGPNPAGSPTGSTGHSLRRQPLPPGTAVHHLLRRRRPVPRAPGAADDSKRKAARLEVAVSGDRCRGSGFGNGGGYACQDLRIGRGGSWSAQGSSPATWRRSSSPRSPRPVRCADSASRTPPRCATPCTPRWTRRACAGRGHRGPTQVTLRRVAAPRPRPAPDHRLRQLANATAKPWPPTCHHPNAWQCHHHCNRCRTT